MMVKSFVFLLLFLISWSLASVVEARNFRGPKNKSADLEKLVQEADVIVVGQVLTIDQLEETTYLEHGYKIEGHRYQAMFHIDRVIHTPSEIQVKDQLQFDYLQSDIPNGSQITVGTLGMYFFQFKLDGTLTVVDPHYTCIPALPLLAEDVNQKLPQAQNPFEKVQIELIALLTHSNQLQAREQVLYMLRKIPNPEINATCHQLLKKEEGPFLESLFETLILRDDFSVLEEAVTFALRQSQNETGEYPDRTLSLAIRDKINDIKFLPLLLPLLDSPKWHLREAGYFAIREMQNKQCIPYLLRALRDPEKEVRFHGVFGLSVMMGQPKWYPGGDDWVNNDRKIIDHWLKWGENYLRRKKKEPNHSPSLDSF